jgi:hypothetical protein
MVEARIDETGARAFGRLLASRRIVEEVAASSAEPKTKVDVRKTGGLTAPSDSIGS